eukprot:PhF_6_TR14085/c0_g1_i1/m.22502/K05544/DUS3; tRNA-dihydrouridine synthase 3
MSAEVPTETIVAAPTSADVVVKGMCHVKKEFVIRNEDKKSKEWGTEYPPLGTPAVVSDPNITREQERERLFAMERNFFESPMSLKARCRELVKEVTDKKKRQREDNVQPTKQEETKEDPTNQDRSAENAAVAAEATPQHEKENRRPPLDVDGLLYLSPLTTVGNLPYRRVCKDYGVDITCGEMALAYNLLRLERNEWSLLRKSVSEGKGPSGRGLFGVQIATSNGIEAKAVAEIISKTNYDIDFVDVNCGCPIDLVVDRGCGSALLNRPQRIRDIVQGLTSFISKPVTIKVRIGDDERKPNLHKFIGDIGSWGCSAITIHGRSRRQRYTKEANWDYIKECAAISPVPVIGNGDIMSYEDYVKHRTEHGVGCVMIGRGALIKPWVFEEIRSQRVGWDISSHERFEMLRKYCNYGLEHWGSDDRGVETTRKFLLEWLSFLFRYVPVGVLETIPQRMNERPPYYQGRDFMETLMGSDDVRDWIRISEMLLGPVKKEFKFTPKHKTSMYTVNEDGQPIKMSETGRIEHE